MLLVLGVCCYASDPVIDLIVWGRQIGPNDKGLDDVIRRFEELHPNVRVHMLGMGAGRMNPQKLMTAIVGGVPPDVVFQDRFAVPDWAYLGAFEPLDTLIERDKLIDPRTPTEDKYYPAPWTEATFQGHVYAIPFMADSRALYWNRAVFKAKSRELLEAGLDPTRPPRTWSETLAYSKVLTEFEENGALKRAGFMPNFGNSWLYMYAFQNNASFMSADGRECTLNTPESREALQFMVDGYRVLGGMDNSEKFRLGLKGEESDPFFTGQIAMKIDGDWFMPGIAKYAPTLDFGTAPPPIPDDRYSGVGRFQNESKKFISWAGGFCHVIPKGARNKEMAWEFIKHVSSTEMRLLEMESYAKLERERGRLYVPRPSAEIRTNLLASERFMPSTGNLRDAAKMHMELLLVSKFRPSTFAGQRLWDEHVRAMDLALRETVTPDVALQSGEDKVQDYLDEVYSKEKYPVADLRIPSVVGVIGFLFGSVLFAGWFKRKNLGKLSKHEALWGLAFVAPWILGFIVFTLGPMFASLYLSFTSYDIFNPPRWVGVDNYSSLFIEDKELLIKSFMNVLYIGGIGVPLGIVTGLALAMLLNAGVRGLRFYRTAFYLPTIVPGIAGIVLWMWILNADPNRGVVNAVWTHTIQAWFGTQPPVWFFVEPWAKPALIAVGLWGAGGGMILWLAGLKGIPQTLYEAASIDGASGVKQFWNITSPQLSPLIFFNVIMGAIGALQTFDSVFVVLKGESSGPNDSLLVPVYFLFQQAFYYFKLGYASAIAWLLFLIVLLVTLAQFHFANRWVHYEVDR